MTDVAASTADRPLRAVGVEHVCEACARELCRRHGAALLALASMVLGDADTSGDIVASAISVACRDHRLRSLSDSVTRARLARSVYHRCLGHLAVMERFPQLTHARSRRRSAPLDHLTAEQRMILALVVFGGHDIA
ncbi:hypothetical protein GA0070616_4918 [Micromonospora nigra]|uniref:Uncharacterized protein n=1 Tax=Micromonospora nigra TaxID=145857 RepID=A0A1C6SXA7_9ACTN|nr:hypothetical protein [Micromonospora nigra]SCL34234.1 hypothetical protein GA0070616_4918 [Micromonospora nigra]